MQERHMLFEMNQSYRVKDFHMHSYWILILKNPLLRMMPSLIRKEYV